MSWREELGQWAVDQAPRVARRAAQEARETAGAVRHVADEGTRAIARIEVWAIVGVSVLVGGLLLMAAVRK